jgi:hypothetical protein
MNANMILKGDKSMWKPGEPIFDLEGIKKDLQNAEIIENDMGDMEKAAYLCSIYSVPSGKFYTPFACSNVADCPQCRGNGTVGFSPKKRIRKKAEKRVKKYFSGGEYYKKRNAPLSTCERFFKTYKKAVKLAFGSTTCPNCGGLGSREAYLDELWHEQAEREIESINCAFTAYEESFFATQLIDDEE